MSDRNSEVKDSLCNFKIKMLNGIMGEISIEESLLLKEHLREREECRREYEGLKEQ